MVNPAAGGAELFTSQVAKRWAKQGHQMTLFAPMFDGCRREETIDDVKFVRRGSWLTVYNEARKFYHEEGNGKFDVVIDGINTVPFLTPLYVKEKKVAVVFQLIKTKFLTRLPHLMGVAGLFGEPLIHFLLYSRLPAITLSQSVKNDLGLLGYDLSRVFVAEPGVDHLPNPRVGTKTEYPSVLYLNRLVPYKNVEHLVKAFKIVVKCLPRTKLVVAGCRGGAYEKSLRSMVNTLGLSDSVEFLEFVQGRKKTNLLGSAWVHVLPSSIEGWGISITEAAACGTPTIAYYVAGVRDSVRHGLTGLLVEHGNWIALASAIVSVLSDQELRDKLSSNAANWASNLTWEGTAKLAIQALSCESR